MKLDNPTWLGLVYGVLGSGNMMQEQLTFLTDPNRSNYDKIREMNVAGKSKVEQTCRKKTGVNASTNKGDPNRHVILYIYSLPLTIHFSAFSPFLTFDPL